MTAKNKQLAMKLVNYLIREKSLRLIKWEIKPLKDNIAALLDGAYPEPPDEVTPPYIIKDCDCTEKIQALEEHIGLLNGAFLAQDKMQNHQLDSWRERLKIPDHIVAGSDVVDDLCDHCAGELAALKAEVLEAIKPFDASYYNGDDDDYTIMDDNYEPICTVGELRRLAALCEKLEAK